MRVKACSWKKWFVRSIWQHWKVCLGKDALSIEMICFEKFPLRTFREPYVRRLLRDKREQIRHFMSEKKPTSIFLDLAPISLFMKRTKNSRQTKWGREAFEEKRPSFVSPYSAEKSLISKPSRNKYGSISNFSYALSWVRSIGYEKYTNESLRS